MNKIFTLFIGIVVSSTILYSQEAPPQAFSYKATITKTLPNGNIVVVPNNSIGLKISILKGDQGTEVYWETFKPRTNSSGQIDIVIGRNPDLGSPVFSSIPWSDGIFSLHVWIDLNGGTNYGTTPMSSTQLLSVPYALYADKAGSAVNETDPIFNASPSRDITNGNIDNWNSTDWYEINGKPNFAKVATSGIFSDLTSTPSTVDGYGITDAVTTFGNQTISGNKTFTGTSIISNAISAANGFGSVYSNIEKRPILGTRGNVSIGTESKWDWSELDVNGGINVLPGQWDWGSGIALSAWDAQGGGGEQYLIGSTGVKAHEGPGKFFIRNTDHYWDAIFIMDNQGRVGIDMDFDGLPQYTLDVKGDINFTGNLLKNGSPYGTSWNNISGMPTTLSGYGITDAATKATVDELSAKIDALTARVAALEGGGSSNVITDKDGNIYTSVTIGTQVWMVENLKATKLNDGTDITLATDNIEWGSLTTNGYCWPNNDASNKTPYGALYNWYAVGSGKLCPTGWQVPSDVDWTTLKNYLIANGYNYDGTTTGNKIAKAMASTTLWTTSSNAGAPGNTDYPDYRNKSGFTGFPSGYRTEDGTFAGLHGITGWWSTSNYNASTKSVWLLVESASDLWYGGNPEKRGGSVRCLKD